MKKRFISIFVAVCFGLAGSSFLLAGCYENDKNGGGSLRPQLGSPSGLRVQNDFLIWDAVDLAIAYQVRINDGQVHLVDYGVWFNLPSEVLEEGTESRLYVRTVADGIGFDDSGWSYLWHTVPTPVILPRLPTPTFGFDNIRGKIYWHSIENASGYLLREREQEDCYQQK